MGRELNGHFEVKIDGEWHHYAVASRTRNHRIFSKMSSVWADDDIVRAQEEPYECIPDDASKVTKASRFSDRESLSYLNASELVEIVCWVNGQNLEHPDIRNRRTMFDDFFGSGMESLITRYQDMGFEDVRLVFSID